MFVVSKMTDKIHIANWVCYWLQSRLHFLSFAWFWSLSIELQLQLQKFRDELKNRSRVLKKLGHIDADGVVQLKGRAACLIDTGDELLITELMFNGEFMILSSHFCNKSLDRLQCWVLYLCILILTEQTSLGTFNDLDPHQVAALASCFVPGDRSNEQIHLRTELGKPLQQLQDSARRIAEVC